MKSLNFVLLLVFGAACVGCGPASVSDNPIEVEQEASPVKPMLEAVAESGELGSEAMTIREGLEMMKNSGDAKADELLKDLDELEKTSGSAGIKKKAKEMLGKL